MTRRRAASAAARRQPAHRASKGCCNLAFAGSDRRNHPILQQPARGHPRAPSLDQKIPGVGYTKSNFEVVCWQYNMAKHAYPVGLLNDLSIGVLTGIADRVGNFILETMPDFAAELLKETQYARPGPSSS
jgi:hypothetical protein